ncbi:MAG: type IV secretion system DNA-binding domain-containing protein, partial [Pseudomonadota bacterium]
HVHEGIRYGTSKTMDGAQLSVGRATEPIVLASDIMRMPDLECVLMLPGNWPVGRVRLRFDKRRDAPAPKAQGLIPKPAEETVFHALDQAGWQPLAEGTERMNAEDIAREAAARAPDTEQVQRAPGRDPGAGEATPRPGKKMAVKPLRSRPGRARPASAQIDLGLGHPDDDRGQPRR